jgi:hypothetical protein
MLHQQEAAGPAPCPVLSDGPLGGECDPNSPSYYPGILKYANNWSDSSAKEREEHRIADFAVGRDLGLGLFADGHSTVRAGIRYAQFQSITRADMIGIPDWNLPEGWAKYFISPAPQYAATRHEYRASVEADREFKGAGPTLSWEAAQHLLGSDEMGHVDLDWSITGGVLFGKQKTSLSGTYEVSYSNSKYAAPVNLPPLTPTPLGVPSRSKSVSVPMLDLSLGLAYEIQRVKVGAGYRWERYYDVLDAGQDEHRSFDRTMDGPYFKIAVGFGG